jgi:hypothetical protein
MKKILLAAITTLSLSYSSTAVKFPTFGTQSDLFDDKERKKEHEAQERQRKCEEMANLFFALKHNLELTNDKDEKVGIARDMEKLFKQYTKKCMDKDDIQLHPLN